MIRSIQLGDASWICDIWEKWYKDEMPCPNFLDKFLCAFTVMNNDQPIIIGGVRTIAESVILTDKSLPKKTRMRAIYETLEASKFVANRSGYNNLNAFIHDPIWARCLIKMGFKSEEILTLQL